MTKDVLISVDKSRPVLTNSRHKNAHSAATQWRTGPLCHSNAIGRGDGSDVTMARDDASVPNNGPGCV